MFNREWKKICRAQRNWKIKKWLQDERKFAFANVFNDPRIQNAFLLLCRLQGYADTERQI